MLTLPIRTALGSLALAALVASPAALTAQDAATEIGAVNASFVEAINAGDAAAVAAHYTDDAILMAPNAPMARGHEAIAAAFGGMMEMGDLRIQLMSDEIEPHGDTAIETGRFVLELADGTHLDHGKWIVVWKHTADGWKLHRDIFNSDMPAPTGG